MSYIQDALRRADAEHKRVSAPALRKLPVLTERYESPIKRPSQTRTAVVAFALLVVAGGLLWRAWTEGTPAPAAPPAASTDAAAAATPVAQTQADRPATPPTVATASVAAPPSTSEPPQPGTAGATTAAAPSAAVLAAAPQQAPSPATTSSPAMTKPAEPGSVPAKPASQEDLERFLGSLIRDEAAAWRQLAALWRVDVAAGPDPCAALASGDVLCHRAAATAVDRLRVLDRPGIVKLQLAGRNAGSAVLTAIGPDAVTLRAGDAAVTVPLDSFKRIWSGEFATLWRKPAGWDAKDTAATGDKVTSWLAQRMAQIERKPAGGSPPSAQALKASVQAFQRAHGLTGGGVAGPVTLMLVNRATGVDEPRLDRMAASSTTR